MASCAAVTLKESVEATVTAGDQPELHPVSRLTYVSTALRLGLWNVARVAIYGVCKRIGIYRWLLPQGKATPLEFRIDLARRDAAQLPASCADRSVLIEADELLAGRVNYFSAHSHNIGNPPNWFLDPFQNKRHSQSSLHWSRIADFRENAGDIKVTWEASRFDWASVFARSWRISGDSRYLSALQLWMQDWWQNNPPNTGPNWMCGQETSIRLINVLLALRIARMEKNAGSGLTSFVEAHCRRIDVTRSYAVAQDNNHGTSEAAGLFVGGTWLARYSDAEARHRGQQWAQKGRELLERAVCRLVLLDGSFSQHSLTYHRVLLDTLSVVEAWRRSMEDVPFAQDFYTRAAAATRWLGAMLDPASGDGPNLGSNDGAHPYRLDASDYRDFRPCLQLASVTFIDAPALEAGPWDESASWLGISASEGVRSWLSDLGSSVFSEGGYVLMRNRTGARVLLRTPTARFRPAHADALHLDLLWKGKDLLRDGGTYSYVHGAGVGKLLSSVVGHNIPQFDDRDQMPRLGRFLYGYWIRVVGLHPLTSSADGQSCAGSYTDFCGAQHQRTVTLSEETVSVLDQMQGFKRKAVLRWRLAPGNWVQTETGCVSDTARIQVESSVRIRRITLESGWESRHYLEKSPVPVLEVEIDQSPALLTTTVTLY